MGRELHTYFTQFLLMLADDCMIIKMRKLVLVDNYSLNYRPYVIFNSALVLSLYLFQVHTL